VPKVERKERPSVDVVFMGHPPSLSRIPNIETDPMDLRMDNIVQMTLRINEALPPQIGHCILTGMILGSQSVHTDRYDGDGHVWGG